jgi:hypothetical protein
MQYARKLVGDTSVGDELTMHPKRRSNAHTVLCAVVLTSPVLAMATYTASEPPTCATNVCNANCVVCSGADLPGTGHGDLHRLRAAHLRYQCGRRVDQGILSYHHQEHSRQVLKNRLLYLLRILDIFCRAEVFCPLHP